MKAKSPNVHEARTKLSRLLTEVEKGKEIIPDIFRYDIATLDARK